MTVILDPFTRANGPVGLTPTGEVWVGAAGGASVAQIVSGALDGASLTEPAVINTGGPTLSGSVRYTPPAAGSWNFGLELAGVTPIKRIELEFVSDGTGATEDYYLTAFDDTGAGYAGGLAASSTNPPQGPFTAGYTYDPATGVVTVTRDGAVMATVDIATMATPIPNATYAAGTYAGLGSAWTGSLTDFSVSTDAAAPPAGVTAHLTGVASVAISAPAVTVQTIKRLTAWAGDASGQAQVAVKAYGTLDAAPAVEPPPPDGRPVPEGDTPPVPGRGAIARTIRQQAFIMPAMPVIVNGRPKTAWVPSGKTDVIAGRFRVVVGGKDVTFFGGIDAQLNDYSTTEAFGPETATVTFPSVSPLSGVGAGALSWLADGVAVEIDFLHAGTNTLERLWEGWIASHEDSANESGLGVTIQCKGVLLQADSILKQPDFHLEPTDAGTLLAKAFNAVPGRRYATFPTVVTGEKVAVRGTWQPLTNWADEVLSMLTTGAGLNSWTVDVNNGRVPVVKLKDRTTQHYHVTLGAPGVAIAISRDLTQATNVVYGSATDDKGNHYANQKFPNMFWGAVPSYLSSNRSNVFGIGSTDADTQSGKGISDFQRQMVSRGYKMSVDGSWSTTDAAVLKHAQTDMGLSADGIIGPQSFDGVYDIGTANAGSLDGAYHAPFAFDPAVEPFNHSASGAITTKNAAFKATRIRVERFETYPDGTTKDQALKSAQAEVNRDKEPGWVGTITLTSDPAECSRRLLRAGRNIVLKGHRGVDRLFHIARVSVANSAPGAPVTLTVDTNARDLATLAEIIKRNKDAIGPARLKNRRTKSQILAARPAFDAESAAGLIRRHPVNGDSKLWTVVRVPLGWAGNVARMDFTTSNLETEFAVAIFAGKVTPADMARLVGNPLIARVDGYEPFSKNADALDALGLCYAAGGPQQPCGFYPGQKVGSDGMPTGHPVTGRFRDDAGFAFETDIAPYIYVAEFASKSCDIEGRLWVAPGEF